MEAFWWIATTVICILYAYWRFQVPKGLPPGSAGIPFLGVTALLNPYVHLGAAKLGKKYGNIFYAYCGQKLIIILNDYATTKEALIKQGDIFSGRPKNIMFGTTEQDNLGVTVVDGEFWKQHRRFILSNLRDFGVGKMSLEPLILNEIRNFIGFIQKKDGEDFDAKQLLSLSLANNIHTLLTGKRYNYDDDILTEVEMLSRSFSKVARATSIREFFPWFYYLPGANIISTRSSAMSQVRRLLDIIGGILEDAKKSYIVGERDSYAQAYWTEQNHRRKLDSGDKIFTDIALLHNTRDLMAAGTDTTATTLLWCMLYLTKYPQVQRRIQEEIKNVIGKEREPSYNDRTNMPYTEATIWEVHRIVSITPLTIPHRNITETTISGYRIPKDSMIFINLWTIHHDPKLWGDPDNFRPERFIDDNGQFNKPEYLIPFSIGKRACIGEPLAKMELFLYLVSLLQNFDLVTPKAGEPNLDPCPGISLQPKSAIVCAKSQK